MGTGILTPRLWRGGPRRSRDTRRAFRIVSMDSNWAVMDLFVLRARFTWMGSLLPLGSRPTWMMKLINVLPLCFLLCMDIMLSGTPHVFLCHSFPVSLASENLFVSCAVFPGICLCFNVLFSPWIRPLCRWTVGRIDGHRGQPGISANFFFWRQGFRVFQPLSLSYFFPDPLSIQCWRPQSNTERFFPTLSPTVG